MTIYERLKTDHDEHRRLLAEIAETSGDTQKRQTLWTKFYYDVSAHAAAEDEAFYAPMMKTPDGQPHARHSVAEHQELDEIMQELNEMDMSSTGWLTRFRTLKDRYEHHLEEEENEIFEVARTALGDDASGTIAEKFGARKDNERSLVDQKAKAALEH